MIFAHLATFSSLNNVYGQKSKKNWPPRAAVTKFSLLNWRPGAVFFPGRVKSPHSSSEFRSEGHLCRHLDGEDTGSLATAPSSRRLTNSTLFRGRFRTRLRVSVVGPSWIPSTIPNLSQSRHSGLASCSWGSVPWHWTASHFITPYLPTNTTR